MENFKEVLDKNPIFGIVAEASKLLHLETYVVGGYVRDLFLMRPNKDIDFVTVGSGIELAQKASELAGLQNHVNIFKNFGKCYHENKCVVYLFIIIIFFYFGQNWLCEQIGHRFFFFNQISYLCRTYI